MKKLNLFQKFDFAAWQKGKAFMVQGIRYNEKKGCVSLDVIIVEDNTNYGDASVSNLFEKFKVHCIKDTDDDDTEKYQIRDMIRFTSVGKCTVWGDYASQLSVEAVVEVVKQ
ncbi:MAG: hypothetical protein J1E83_08915 [Lachnospiraceae bacterium]|nr:hypothetical protein [Lachnospiraceae bacterium]